MDSISSRNLFIFKQEDLLIKNMSFLQELRRKGIFCDVVIKAGGQEFPAHRNILAAAIPYFYTMFTSEYVESTQREIDLKNIESSALETLIDFCYSGKIKIDSRNVLKLIKIADFFQLNQVKNACGDYLTSNIQAENAIEIKKFANLLNFKQLESAANEFLNENFSEISESNDFLMLEFKELKELIGNDGITCSEEKVFDAALKWVKYNEDERISLLPEILSKVRLSLVSTEFLVNVVSKNELIWSSYECLLIVDKAKTYHLMQGGNKLTHESRDLPKLYKLVPILHENQLKIYNASNNEWLTDVPLNGNRSDSEIVSLESKIYMIGGCPNKKSVDVYDLKTKEWSKGENMITGRYGFGATALNDCIYVCGGSRGSNYLSSVECYSVKENTWKEVAPMTIQRRFAGVTSLNGYIYTIGGYNTEQGPLDSCEKYDPKSNTWTIIKPLNIKIYGLGIATLNNKIYACGGYGNSDYSNSCEIYDPSTNTWSNIAPMNECRYSFSLKSINGKLYAVGGANLSGDLPSVEVYTPEANSWEILTQNC